MYMNKIERPYISLHNHTDNSNLKFPDSIIKVEELIDYAHDQGMPGVAITDHECVSSYVKAQKHLKKRRKENIEDKSWQDFKLILGNEIYLCRNGLTKENFRRGEDKYFHFIIWAKDEIGNKQVRELSSRAWGRSYMYFHRRTPTYFSDLEEIVQNNQGHIMASSACLGGQLPYLINKVIDAEKQNDDEERELYYDACIRWLNKMLELFGRGNFYLELQPGLTNEQIQVNLKLIELGAVMNLDCIITTDSHYLKEEDRPIHEAYLNSKDGDREVAEFYEAAHMMDSEELWTRMNEYLDVETFNLFLDNTLMIGQKCEDYSILKPLKIPYTQEDCLVPKLESWISKYKNLHSIILSKEVSDRQLAVKLYTYLLNPDTYGDREKNAERIDYELGVILDSSNKNNVRWSAYLLRMAEYCDIIWNQGNSLICPSRGSGGASYILYALGITQINPLREDVPLLFERFMNPERVSVLDIDIDVESTKRNRCISALQNKYGADRVIRVSTFKTEKSKSAILAAARGLSIDVDTARYIASLIGSERGMQYTLDDMYYGNPEKDLKPNPTFIHEMEKRPELWEIAHRIEGMVCGVG